VHPNPPNTPSPHLQYLQSILFVGVVGIILTTPWKLIGIEMNLEKEITLTGLSEFELKFKKAIDLEYDEVRYLSSLGAGNPKLGVKKLCEMYSTKINATSVRITEDFIVLWIARNNTKRVKASQVWEYYLVCCKAHNVTPLGRNTFYKMCQNRLVDKKISSGKQVWFSVHPRLSEKYRENLEFEEYEVIYEFFPQELTFQQE